MLEHESRPEIINQDPFVIRGHHLKPYAILIRIKTISISPEFLAEWSVSKLEMEHELAMKHPDSVILKKRIEHDKDILGPSLGQADKVKKHWRKVFENFLNLHEDYPVKIIEGVPDAICKGCAIGEHCRELALEKDGSYIDAFLKDVDYINSKLRENIPQPSLTYEKATFSNAPPQNVRSIRTTSGAVKKVFTKGASFLW